MKMIIGVHDNNNNSSSFSIVLPNRNKLNYNMYAYARNKKCFSLAHYILGETKFATFSNHKVWLFKCKICGFVEISNMQLNNLVKLSMSWPVLWHLELLSSTFWHLSSVTSKDLGTTSFDWSWLLYGVLFFVFFLSESYSIWQQLIYSFCICGQKI